VHVVATAGHVDHGKSTLVEALTGTDPDRLREEKERGLTIDLGYAWTTLPSGAGLAFVDVPGHVRFLKNMLAGVGAVDACLFVVAATEGWKPQSEEHLRILELLGIGHGVIALTKVGLVDDEWRQLAELDVLDRVAGTFLEGAEIVAVDPPTGFGLDGDAGLPAALDRLLAATPQALDRGRPRLWVDRAFAARGSGTVVTGTLTGGSLRVDEEVTIEPGGRMARIRGLQSHGQSHAVAGPGRRVGVNLAGVSHHQVTRGQAVIWPRQWHLTAMIDASLRVLAGLDHPVSRRGAYMAYIGSGEHPVNMRVLGQVASLDPGQTGLVRLWLPTALPLVPGDHYVLRESGRSQTIGGGEVLDVAPVLPASRARPSRSIERVVAERGWVEASELERLTGEPATPTLGHWVVDPLALRDASAELRAMIAGPGPLGLDVALLTERQREILATIDDARVDAGRVFGPGYGPANISSMLESHPYLIALEASPFDPPPPVGVDPQELRALATTGLIVDCSGTWFAADAVEAAARTVAEALAVSPGGITVSEVRDALGTSRRHVIPLLTRFDATGVTRRRGDLRIAGPRLPVVPQPKP
jgi:selenocysteine-specific elongation factor